MNGRRLPDEATRRLVARTGGQARVLAATTPADVSAPARAAFLARFEREVDPDGTLPPDVRAAKAKAALSAQMSRVALAKKRAQRGRSAAVEKPAAPPPARAAPEPAPLTWEQFLAARAVRVRGSRPDEPGGSGPTTTPDGKGQT
ncbi:hypothetical protein [Parafrankia soli]|uniref:hypothetical protein n=1 Tax=Parafrankia soli TaxID=2599596 RepID=UPI0009F1BA59|nr:hypothetical protein [Parafrankia soli]